MFTLSQKSLPRTHTLRLRLERLEDRVAPAGLPFSELLVFGDSLSETGNAFARSGGFVPPPVDVNGSPLYFQGRFTNGPNWVETLAEELNLPTPLPVVAGGTNYAFPSARTGDGTFDLGGGLPPIPNIGTQIDMLLDPTDGVGPTDPSLEDSLVALWGGATNFFNLLGPTLPTLEDLTELATTTVTDMTQHVSDLLTAGAKHVVVPNLSPLELIPVFATYPPEVRGAIGFAVGTINTGLNGSLAALQQTFGPLGAQIYQVDTNGLLKEVIANPAAAGFANATDAFCPECEFGSNPAVMAELPPGDPNSFVFWDIVHPSAAGHERIGERAAQAIFDQLGVGGFVVDTLADVIDNNDGQTSLREAIGLANNFSGPQTIRFAGPARPRTVYLTQGQLDLTDDVHIQGRHRSISGSGDSRVFQVHSGVTATLEGLALRDGVADVGGAILNEGTLNLGFSLVTHNQATGDSVQALGGGIYNVAGATLNITNSQFVHNSASGAETNGGGGIANAGVVTLSRTLFLHNSAEGGAANFGGGLANLEQGELAIFRSWILVNQVTGKNAPTGTGGNAFGGGIYAATNSQVRLDRSLVLLNSATGGKGSSRTKGDGLGGGIYLESGATLTSDRSVVLVNCASTAGKDVFIEG